MQTRSVSSNVDLDLAQAFEFLQTVIACLKCYVLSQLCLQQASKLSFCDGNCCKLFFLQIDGRRTQ